MGRIAEKMTFPADQSAVWSSNLNRVFRSPHITASRWNSPIYNSSMRRFDPPGGSNYPQIEDWSWHDLSSHKVNKHAVSDRIGTQSRHLHLCFHHPHQTTRRWDDMHFVELDELYKNMYSEKLTRITNAWNDMVWAHTKSTSIPAVCGQLWLGTFKSG